MLKVWQQLINSFSWDSGRAEWMDKNHRKCLILWRRIQDWAELLLDFVHHNLPFQFTLSDYNGPNDASLLL